MCVLILVPVFLRCFNKAPVRLRSPFLEMNPYGRYIRRYLKTKAALVWIFGFYIFGELILYTFLFVIAGTNDKFRGLPGKDALALCDNANDSKYTECEWREVDYVKVCIRNNIDHVTLIFPFIFVYQLHLPVDISVTWIKLKRFIYIYMYM